MANGWKSNLISAEGLFARLDDADWIVVDCRFNLMRPDAGRLAYEAGHIPGAVYADLDRDLAAPVAADGSGGRHPLPDPREFGRKLANWGIGPDSVVVAYDDMANAVAARLWWMLRWLGHERVAVLDGGFGAWVKADGPLTTEIPQPVAGLFEPVPGSMPVVDSERPRSIARCTSQAAMYASAPFRSYSCSTRNTRRVAAGRVGWQRQRA